ncbi:MAG: hypothetical protein IIC01_12140, partial [Planctomycetes bacterium]|nr:hypothetical protein [Planctomycetota bacterium]
LGIASDYWKSGDFYSDYPGVAKTGFGPAGRFGIGFLSVFMIGDRVEVRTQRRGGEALALMLYGVGRRGALRTDGDGPRSGTMVRVRIKKSEPWDCKDLTAMVRAKAPMLTLPVSVSEKGSTTRVEPAWWRDLSQDELHRFVLDQPGSAKYAAGASEQHDPLDWFGRRQLRENMEPFSVWLNEAPELVDGSKRILALPWANRIVLCSSGLAVEYWDDEGLVGLAEIGPVELNVARSTLVGWDAKTFGASIRQGLRPGILHALDALEGEGRVPDRFEFLLTVGVAYGDDVLTETNLPWMTLIEPPGSARLLSPAELRSRLANHNELLVGYSTGPWTAARECFRYFPDSPRGTLLLPVSKADGPSIHTDYTRKETISSHLNEHFADEELAGAALLTATLRVIAEAWDVTFDDLRTAEWRRRADDDTICGYLMH